MWCWAGVGICPRVNGGAPAAACARVVHLELARTSCNCWMLHLGVPLLMFEMGWICKIISTPPGVFARVWQWCMRGVFLKALFAVGLRACMMGGAFVIQVMVRIGVLSITLCSSSLALCCSSVTLCSVRGVAVERGGLRMICRLDCNNLEGAILYLLRQRLPLSPTAHLWERRGVGAGTCLVFGSAGDRALLTPICNMLAFLKYRIGYISIGPVMVPDTIHWHLLMHMIHTCWRPHISQLCTLAA